MYPVFARLSIVFLSVYLSTLPGRTQPSGPETNLERERQEAIEAILSQGVTVNYDNLSLGEILKDLSAKTGVSMEVVPGLTPVRLMVKTHEVPLHRLMHALSMVVSPGTIARCHWLKQPDDAGGLRFLLWPEPAAVEAQGQLEEEDRKAFQRRYLRDIFEHPEQFDQATHICGRIFRTLSPESQQQALEDAFDLGQFNEAPADVQQGVRDLFALYQLKVLDKKTGEVRPVDVDQDYGKAVLRFVKGGSGLDQHLRFEVKRSNSAKRGMSWGFGRLPKMIRKRMITAQEAVAPTNETALEPLHSPLPEGFYQVMIDEDQGNTKNWDGINYPADAVDIAKIWQWLSEHTQFSIVALCPAKSEAFLPAIPVANLKELLDLLVQTHAITYQLNGDILIFRPTLWYHDPPLLPSEDVLRWQAAAKPENIFSLDLLAEIATLSRAQYQVLQSILPNEEELKEARPFLLFYLSVPPNRRPAMFRPSILNLQDHSQPAVKVLVESVVEDHSPTPPLGVAEEITLEERMEAGQRVVEYQVKVAGLGLLTKTFTVGPASDS